MQVLLASRTSVSHEPHKCRSGAVQVSYKRGTNAPFLPVADTSLLFLFQILVDSDDRE